MSQHEAIDPYLRTLFFRDGFANIRFPEGYARADEFREELRRCLAVSVEPYVGGLAETKEYLVDELFIELLSNSVIVEEQDPFAGSYYAYIPGNAPPVVNSFLKNDEITRRAKRIGERYLSDVFKGYVDDNVDRDLPFVALEIPASNRIVTLGDNQRHLIEPEVDALVSKLEADNGVPDVPGFRERILGQMRAGRELLRAGEFRAYALYVTLLRGLAEISARYKDKAIGAAANHLIELLINNIFGVGS